MKETGSKINSLEKALALLDLFSEEVASLTLDEIVALSGYSKSTVFRMVSSFEKFGYLSKVQKGGEMKISLGMRFLEKSRYVSSQLEIKRAAKMPMLQLRQKTGLSVQLAVKSGLEAIYIEQFESMKAVRVYPQVGRKVPLYAAACPRVLLSGLSEKDIRTYICNQELSSFTEQTLNEKEELLNEMMKIKEQGYSISKGELYSGTLAIAVPIYHPPGHIVAALSVIGLEQDFETESLEHFLQLLNDASKKITDYLASK